MNIDRIARAVIGVDEALARCGRICKNISRKEAEEVAVRQLKTACKMLEEVEDRAGSAGVLLNTSARYERLAVEQYRLASQMEEVVSDSAIAADSLIALWEECARKFVAMGSILVEELDTLQAPATVGDGDERD